MNVPKQVHPFVTQTLSVRTPSAHLNVNVMMGSLDLAIFVFKVSISHAHVIYSGYSNIAMDHFRQLNKISTLAVRVCGSLFVIEHH